MNLRLTRKNLEQQRELAQGSALQAYYKQIDKLQTEYDLRITQGEEIWELAQGQTLTVLQEVDGNGKQGGPRGVLPEVFFCPWEGRGCRLPACAGSPKGVRYQVVYGAMRGYKASLK